MNQVRKVDYPAPPETTIEEVEQSEHKEEIFGLLCSGVSPARTTSIINKKNGATLTNTAVRQYYESIPTKYFLPVGELRRRLNLLDVQVDVFGEMARLLKYTQGQVDIALLADDIHPGEPSHSTGLVKQYWGMLGEYAELQKELEAPPPTTTAEPGDVLLPTLRALLALGAPSAAPVNALEGSYEVIDPGSAVNTRGSAEELLPVDTAGGRVARAKT